MANMFAYCPSLTSLDLSSFDTSGVTSMEWMFYNCTKLSILNLSNFSTSSLTNAHEILIYCNNIEYINFFEYKETSEINFVNIIENVRENIVICLNENNNIDYIKGIINSKPCAIIDCSVNWKDNQIKIIAENRTCINNCSNFEFEIHGVCYTICPEDEDICKPKIETTQIIIDTTNKDNNPISSQNVDNIVTTSIDNNIVEKILVLKRRILLVKIMKKIPKNNKYCNK